jgi:hypothetical protein
MPDQVVPGDGLVGLQPPLPADPERVLAGRPDPPPADVKVHHLPVTDEHLALVPTRQRREQ